MRYIFAFFSPLRDPFWRDWLFYVFLFFEIPLFVSSIQTGGTEAIWIFFAGTIVYWFIFIVGGAKLRTPGLPLIFGISKKHVEKSSNSSAVASEQELAVNLNDFEHNLKRYASKRSDYLLKSFSSGGKLLETYVDATVVLAAFEGMGTNPMNASLFGPIWFRSIETKRFLPASFCLTDNGFLIFSWRKRPNALLDYFATTISEIRAISILEESKVNLEISQGSRTIGRTRGIVMGEKVDFYPRLAQDASLNEVALIGFYSLVQEISDRI
jgi:hypothetical protein